jgi:hypothetical protein
MSLLQPLLTPETVDVNQQYAIDLAPFFQPYIDAILNKYPGRNVQVQLVGGENFIVGFSFILTDEQGKGEASDQTGSVTAP